MSARETIVAHRYASALIQSAKDRDGALAFGSALDALAGAMGDPTWRRAVVDGRARPEDQLAILKDLAGVVRAPEKIDRFLEVLASGRRLPAIPAIAARYRHLVEQRFGGRRAVLRIAFEPSPALLSDLRSAFEARLGGKLDLAVEVDPALLGGFEVRCGDQLVRADLETRLQALAASLLDDLGGAQAPDSR